MRAAGLVGLDVDPELDGRGLFAPATGLGSHVALCGASSAAARARFTTTANALPRRS
jgi:hypothetical protein